MENTEKIDKNDYNCLPGGSKVRERGKSYGDKDTENSPANKNPDSDFRFSHFIDVQEQDAIKPTGCSPWAWIDLLTAMIRRREMRIV
jgi:hypothetical protein